MIKRTERGWAGHFICAYRCLFRRNTLLECGETKVVVSTVGLLMKPAYDRISLDEMEFDTIGHERYYETKAFHSKGDQFDDADVAEEIEFSSNWRIDRIDAELEANAMHKTVVEEIISMIENGTLPPRLFAEF